MRAALVHQLKRQANSLAALRRGALSCSSSRLSTTTTMVVRMMSASSVPTLRRRPTMQVEDHDDVDRDTILDGPQKRSGDSTFSAHQSQAFNLPRDLTDEELMMDNDKNVLDDDDDDDPEAMEALRNDPEYAKFFYDGSLEDFLEEKEKETKDKSNRIPQGNPFRNEDDDEQVYSRSTKDGDVFCDTRVVQDLVDRRAAAIKTGNEALATQLAMKLSKFHNVQVDDEALEWSVVQPVEDQRNPRKKSMANRWSSQPERQFSMHEGPHPQRRRRTVENEESGSRRRRKNRLKKVFLINEHGHDYQRHRLDNVEVDEEVVHDLLKKRLDAKRTRDFDTADQLMKQLALEHGVEINDKDRLWRTMENRKEQDFNEFGHYYRRSPGDNNGVDLERVHFLIQRRMRARAIGLFSLADELKGQLEDEHSILINDTSEEWRTLKASWSWVPMNGHGHDYKRREGDNVKVDEEAVNELLRRRMEAKKAGKYPLANRLQIQLKQRHNVLVDDKLKEWNASDRIGHKEEAFIWAANHFNRVHRDGVPSAETYILLFKAAKGLSNKEREIDVAYQLCKKNGFHRDRRVRKAYRQVTDH